ncbi:nitrate reductase [Phenylobacterium immobile]|uniref:nitrate reductase n=1 Tax=Phenylobacterium immobile TaxID=21 RepID=UPI000A847225|nr:nitrate reductase [Phenylobacterium immobile]
MTQPATLATTCPYCGVGCGVTASAAAGRQVDIAGDPAHPANYGRLCSKGAALARTVGLDGRLLQPMIGRRGASWARAASLVARTFARTIARHGPDSVAFYVSGQLLTEDYYAANKLMKGFIGSGNIDTNSRLCMASAVAAHKQAFGADLVPGCYEDLELADLVVFSGHNAAWTHPVLVRRMEAARARGQRWVCIDPRRTDTAEMSDLHLAIGPQADVRLWNGLLAHLIGHGVVDRAFIVAHVEGFSAVETELARDDQSISAIASDCGLDPEDVARFYALFAATERTVTLFSMGSNQSQQGVAKALAVINVHLATGRIGKPGAAPFSITGQPNAMGGRETGGLATTLAAHMDFSELERDRVRRFWSAPRMAAGQGLKAVEMFDAVRDGRIKAIWIMATNPAVSMPDTASVRAALRDCPFVVVSEAMAQTDTTALAHVLLPALAWGERNGVVTNSERRVSRQRPIFPAPGEARADWAIIADVATRMGHADAFSWRASAEVFREYARLTAFENEGERLLNLAGLIDADYDQLPPVQWPVTSEGGTARLFTEGRFQTPDGRARMVPVAPKPPAEAVDPSFPLWLNTGRVRDQWHTMTRTALAPELNRHAPEPYVEIHPDDAARAGLSEGMLARVRTARGEAVAVAKITDRQRPGGLFMPMHWTDALAPQGRSNDLIAPHRDAVSGQPEFKHTPARLTAWRDVWRGVFLSRSRADRPAGPGLVWRRTVREACHQHEFAGRGDEVERAFTARALSAGARGDMLSLDDPATGTYRRAWIDGDRLQQVLFITHGRLPPRDWLIDLFAVDSLTAHDRAALLVGRPMGAVEDRGVTVCACFGVGERAIAAAAAAGSRSVEAIGTATRAGTNCGSCRIEINRILAKEITHAA